MLEGVDDGGPFSEDVLDQLSLTVSRNVSDESDRIFGVLGLFKGEVPAALMPDYNRLILDVLADATRYSLIIRIRL
jgi:hypothetical protein